jgi:hypothetical protein
LFSTVDANLKTSADSAIRRRRPQNEYPIAIIDMTKRGIAEKIFIIRVGENAYIAEKILILV